MEGFAPVRQVFSALFDSLSFIGDIFSWFSTQVGFSSQELAGFASAGQTFGSIVAGIFTFLLTPVTAFIELLTGAINIISDIASWVGDLFGSDDVDIKANIVPFSQADVDLTRITRGQSAVSESTAQYNNNVVPFVNNRITPPAVNDSVATIANNPSVTTLSVNNVTSWTTQSAANESLAITNDNSRVVPLPINRVVERNNRIDQAKQSNQETATATSRRVERTEFFNQYLQTSNNRTNTQSDQSRNVHIDTVNIQADDTKNMRDQMLELAS